MRFRVFVDTPADFDKWVKHQLEGPVKTDRRIAAAAGAKIFADAPCAICHTIKGVSGFSKEYTYGFRGPDLTHFGSRGTMAGSMLDNTPENVRDLDHGSRRGQARRQHADAGTQRPRTKRSGCLSGKP